jgi:hypothetical protein
MDFTDVALTALQVVSPVLAAALTWAAAKLASFIRRPAHSPEFLASSRGQNEVDSCAEWP